MSFWLDASAAPARVALGATAFLAMAAQAAEMDSGLPRVPYTKAIDVWQVMESTAISYFSLFGSLYHAYMAMGGIPPSRVEEPK